jgi:hypothetical protein
MMTRSVVIQEDPRRRRRLRVMMGLAAVLLFVAGFTAGSWGGLPLGLESAMENRQLRERVLVMAKELESLRQWKAENETRREIDRTALELVRQELATQQETIAELEKGIHFYRSLMAPDSEADGLSVRSIDIAPGANGKHPFRILVQQSARKHDLLTGTLQVVVNGTLDGEAASYDLSDISDQVPNPDIRLRFKYFQAIDGLLELPAGFTPDSLSVSARSVTPRKSVVNKEIPWAVQEEISHVGQ